jgi:hypothetical protein
MKRRVWQRDIRVVCMRSVTLRGDVGERETTRLVDARYTLDSLKEQTLKGVRSGEDRPEAIG